MFASQVPSAHAFENLTNLSLSLFDWEHSGLLEGTFPLRLLAPALHTLQIANWSGILDPFIYFNTLTFLNLKSLIIIFAIPPTAPFPKSSLQSLHRFILAHSNDLQHLNMNLTASLNPVHVEHLGAWLVDLVNTSVQFPSLQTLRLFSTSTQICLSTLIVLIQRTAPTLSSLNFPIYLTSEEVDRLLDALTEVQVQGANGRQSKLKTLIIHVTLLSVPFLDLLARKLPQLEFLTLFITEIIGSDQVRFFFLPYSQFPTAETYLGLILRSPPPQMLQSAHRLWEPLQRHPSHLEAALPLDLVQGGVVPRRYVRGGGCCTFYSTPLSALPRNLI